MHQLAITSLSLRKSCVALASVVGLVANVNAANFATWDFSTGAGTEISVAATSGDAVNFDLASSIVTRSFDLEGESDPFGEAAGSFWSSRWEALWDANFYMEFSLTPRPGVQYDITDISISVRSSANGGPADWQLRSDSDGFATSKWLLEGGVVTLNDVALSDLTGPVSFRLYGYGNEPGGGGPISFSINGDVQPTVSVPESMSTWVLGVVAIGLFGFHRTWRGRQPVAQ